MTRLTFAFLSLTAALSVNASTLTGAYVHRVNSASGGNEIVSGRGTTTRDHGGTWMHVVTDDVGYGHRAQARLLSNVLREIGKEPLCRTGNSLAPCSRGQTVVGYRRTWDASGHQGGNFEYVVFPSGGGSVQRVAFQVR